MSLNSLTNRNDYIGNDATANYSYTFKIFKKQDLSVYVREIATGTETLLTEGVDFTVSGVKNVSGGAIALIDNGQAWISSGFLKSDYALTLIRIRELKQLTDIKNQGDFYPEIHEDTFDGLVMNDQYLQDQISRSSKLPASVNPSDFNMEIPAAVVGAVNRSFITNADGDGWTIGPSADEIAGAQASAQDAETAKIAAEAAAASAILAAAASSWNDVQYKTFADTPVAVVQTDSGTLFSVDCTGGDVEFELPVISSLDLSGPWSVGFVKTDTTDNKVIINTNGSDVVTPSATSYELSVKDQGVVLVPDVDQTPDKWEALKYGVVDFLNSQMFEDLISDPPSPPSGNLKVYGKSGKFYQKDSTGKVSRLGGGGGGGSGIEWQSNIINGAVKDIETAWTNTDVYLFQSSLNDSVVACYKVPKNHDAGSQKRMIIQVLVAENSFTSKKFKFQCGINLAKQGSGTLNNRTVTVEIGPITSAGAPVLYNLDFDITDSSGQINSVNVESNDCLFLNITRIAASSDELNDVIKLLPYNSEVYDV